MDTTEEDRDKLMNGEVNSLESDADIKVETLSACLFVISPMDIDTTAELIPISSVSYDSIIQLYYLCVEFVSK